MLIIFLTVLMSGIIWNMGLEAYKSYKVITRLSTLDDRKDIWRTALDLIIEERSESITGENKNLLNSQYQSLDDVFEQMEKNLLITEIDRSDKVVIIFKIIKANLNKVRSEADRLTRFTKYNIFMHEYIDTILEVGGHGVTGELGNNLMGIIDIVHLMGLVKSEVLLTQLIITTKQYSSSHKIIISQIRDNQRSIINRIAQQKSNGDAKKSISKLIINFQNNTKNMELNITTGLSHWNKTVEEYLHQLRTLRVFVRDEILQLANVKRYWLTFKLFQIGLLGITLVAMVFFQLKVLFNPLLETQMKLEK